MVLTLKQLNLVLFIYFFHCDASRQLKEEHALEEMAIAENGPDIVYADKTYLPLQKLELSFNLPASEDNAKLGFSPN